jgi:alpha-L-rhamnosidase
MYNIKWHIFLAVILVFFMTIKISVAETLFGPKPPTNLRCEYLVNPMGIDIAEPRFFWTPEHTERGEVQTAYQVLVSTMPDVETGDVWDSGKVRSSRTAQIDFSGIDLQSRKTYFWKVCYWDSQGKLSDYSTIALFETGFLDPEEWEAKWISNQNQLRKEFELIGKVKRARAYVSGLGYYELRINGKKVGQNVLDPGWTTYDKRILYSTYDISGFLRPGNNTIGAILGTGWYGSQTFILQIHLEMENGEEITLITDDTWKSKAGPVVSDSIYNGELYDARLETPGWDLPGFDDSGWENAELSISPKGILRSQMLPPIQIINTIIPRQIMNPKPGVYVYDMGQNFSGWAQLRVSGPRSTRVRMRFAELVYDNGMINRENLRKARAEDIYILKGGKEEIYEPRFTYHGFRYVELTGFPGVPTLDTIRGRVVHTSVSQTGNFSCSNPLLNQLQKNIIWGQKTNLHSIPTDCSQRDERMGWLGDAHLTAEEAMMNFNMGAFYTKFINDIRDVQGKKGTITDTIPFIWGQRPADPAWGTAYPLLCWYMYRFYGDTSILNDHYDGLKNYVDYLIERSKENLLTYSYYGDWVAVDKTPGSLVSAFYYYYDVLLLSKIAFVLNKSEDKKTYMKLAEKIKSAFHKRFYNMETGGYGPNTQTANVLPLFLDMVPSSERGRVIQNLGQDIMYKNNTHLTTGIIGTKYLMEVLTNIHSVPLAFELATQTSYPSWGFMIKNGATTLWELWQNKTGPGMNSHNHPMFGSIGSWMYRTLAGIRQKPESVGYNSIIIEPHMVRDLDHAAGTLQTISGKIHAAWQRTGGSVNLEVLIPVNCKAEIILAKGILRNIILKEGNSLVYAYNKFKTGVKGITMVDEKKDTLVVQIGSGKYVFTLSGE